MSSKVIVTISELAGIWPSANYTRPFLGSTNQVIYLKTLQ